MRLQKRSVAEFFGTFMIILGSTDKRTARPGAGCHWARAHIDPPIGIPVTNLSDNPARSAGPAVFVGGWALQQLWWFWAAPIACAVLAAGVYGAVAAEDQQEVEALRAMAATHRSKSA